MGELPSPLRSWKVCSSMAGRDARLADYLLASQTFQNHLVILELNLKKHICSVFWDLLRQ